MQLIALFAALCALSGAHAAPVPAPKGLLGGLLPLAPAPSASASATASPSTPLNLNALLNELHITLPDGLVTTLNGVDLGALDEIDLAQFVTEVLSFPGVEVPAGTDTTDVVNSVVEDVGGQLDGSGLYDTPTATSASGGIAPHIRQRDKRGLLDGLFGSASRTATGTLPTNTDLLGGIINLSDLNSALTASPSATPSSNSNGLLGLPNEVNLPPYVKVSPSLTLQLAPSGTAKGPVGLINAEVSADVNLLGAKITLGPVVHL
ncbi:hypothetical protein I316_02397 [Kwoniella heveanensis BCC8398]|uniref:Uncharacterized protein n=1 Tax=Kwoniella heveanensis BCC8398 TaxID=1296120 RepID=A0A1B9GY14_9TREE|nr:hypothetical protein I316_02397 [Kwoniella heveanensis BCC8398]